MLNRRGSRWRRACPHPVGDRTALLALAVGLGAALIAGGIRERGRNDVITVTGSAKKRVVSDTVVWKLSLTSDGQTPGPAIRQLAGWTADLRTFFRRYGVTRQELTVQPISSQIPGSTDENGTVFGDYRFTRNFEIDSSRVHLIAAVAEHTKSLVLAGLQLEAEPLQYVYTQLPELRPQLVAAALRDAQKRARAVAGATGANVGGLRAVDVGVFQVTSPNSTEVSDYGEYDTTTRLKDVTAVVNVTFALG